MVKASEFWKFLEGKNYTFFSGVPCSILEPLLRDLDKNNVITYITAARENAALGVASGAYIAGRNSGILMQNSGLGNIVNALTSFNLIYKVPVLIFITWRGHLGNDAPEHIIMGKKTLKLLKTLGIPAVVLSKKYKNEISWAVKEMQKKSIPVAVIIKKDLIK